ncbi:hypothetical protein KIP29_gp60 [Mycobacterium phage BabyRay]|uniref:Uncharacterized protein n=1 Tax=Mycobacterium phage BabyRay TaxID=1897486 RepID=A0A1D8EWA1_9CAUD|nr:hypothetical protein KIP29_gp60 [Mycobacterium phage BabyRay]AOT25483.1 hypothetical protein SEA_BABYRAY_40 [Mycobacterium phage BabyRay]
MSQTDLLRVYEQDGERYVEAQGHLFGLASEPLFQTDWETVHSAYPYPRSYSVNPQTEISFRVYELPPEPVKPKRTWSRAMGLRKPTREEYR